MNFIKQTDALALQINESCNKLFTTLTTIDLDKVELEPFYKNYFIKCHLTRPVFSLQTSARLLYQAIKSTNKPWQEVIIMDYGAGLGTLYILAKMIGVKKIIYNDLLPEFANPAIAVDKFLGIIMDEYIIGDTEETLQILKQKNIECDVIVSRNVLEHIYKLEDFYTTCYTYQPKAIIYSSTTANWNNPLAHLQHVYLHKKYKSVVIKNKLKFILKNFPAIKESEALELSKRYISIGAKDLVNAVNEYVHHKKFIEVQKDYTNICDENGTWGEHLISYKKHRNVALNYNVNFYAGFWDENYYSPLKKIAGKVFNFLTKIAGKRGYVFSSFLYIVAVPKK